jgi:hypothetical protein
MLDYKLAEMSKEALMDKIRVSQDKVWLRLIGNSCYDVEVIRAAANRCYDITEGGKK